MEQLAQMEMLAFKVVADLEQYYLALLVLQ
jgi:hypothetical protein